MMVISWHAADGRMCWTLQKTVMTVTNRSLKNISGRNILSSAVCMDSILIRLRTSISPPSALRVIPRNGISPCVSMEKSLMICSNIQRMNEVTNNRQQLLVEGFSFYAVAEISTTAVRHL